MLPPAISALDLSTTLLNILQTSYSPNDTEDEIIPAETNNDSESSGEEEEYFVCLKCEELGIEHVPGEEGSTHSVSNNPASSVAVKREFEAEPTEEESDNSNGSNVSRNVKRTTASSNNNESNGIQESGNASVSGIVLVADTVVVKNEPTQIESNLNPLVNAQADQIFRPEEIFGPCVSERASAATVARVAPANNGKEPNLPANTQAVESTSELPTEEMSTASVFEDADAAVIEPASLNTVDQKESNLNRLVNAQAVKTTNEPPLSIPTTSVSEGAEAAVDPVNIQPSLSNATYKRHLPLTQSIGIQTEPDIEPINAPELLTTNFPEATDFFDHQDPLISESTSVESTDNRSTQQETTAMEAYSPDNAFTTPVLNRSQAVSEISQYTTTTDSPINGGAAATTNSRNTSTPLPQTSQVKIETRELMNIFQSSPENLLSGLSAFLKEKGIEIVGEDDPQFVNEFKDVKIKIETPGTIKREPGSTRRKRRRSPRFYTPPAKKPAKGSIGSVKTKTGETKVFTEWDSDAYVESD